MHAVGCGKEEQQEAKTAAQGPSSGAPTSSQASKATPSGTASPPAVTTSPSPPPGTKPLTNIESLVAPIALYPDPLLAEVLVAATYPLEVVQAARWLETKPDPATVRDKNWDASVARLTAVPSAIAMMDKHLDWTTQLGDAFLSNPSELMDAVQALRKRASDAGFLKDSEQQNVEAKTVSLSDTEQGTEAKAAPAVMTKEVITIEPAKTDTLSVPSYNPEVVYAAPLASPPATTTGYAAGAAPGYYPTYYPPATTTTTSSNDQWLNFGAGAVVGGLLTWGIMEWADDDDWDDYHVAHYYGDAVCHGGNCWHGGGGGAYGGRYGNVNVDRGDINRNVNISGNEININREGTFKSDQLTALKDQSNRWRPDARHRRGQPYPAAAQQRLGRLQQPALAGSRLSGAENLPAEMRGYGSRQAAQLAAQPRPSSSEIQRQLATKPGKKPPPSKAEARKRPLPKSSESALADLRASGQRVKAESRRGASSLNSRPAEVRKSTGKQGTGIKRQRSERTLAESRRPSQQGVQRSASDTQRFQNRRNQEVQRSQLQQRREAARPSAFESVQDRGRSRNFSSRGNASRVSAQPSRQIGATGGGRAAGGGAARTRGGGRR